MTQPPFHGQRHLMRALERGLRVPLSPLLMGNDILSPPIRSTSIRVQPSRGTVIGTINLEINAWIGVGEPKGVDSQTRRHHSNSLLHLNNGQRSSPPSPLPGKMDPNAAYGAPSTLSTPLGCGPTSPHSVSFWCSETTRTVRWNVGSSIS